MTSHRPTTTIQIIAKDEENVPEHLFNITYLNLEEIKPDHVLQIVYDAIAVAARDPHAPTEDCWDWDTVADHLDFVRRFVIAGIILGFDHMDVTAEAFMVNTTEPLA